MAETDSPLQRLFSAFVSDFAAWLFQAEVRAAQPLNVELPAEMLIADQVFHITLADGATAILHSEFQSRSSHEPPRWRMLDYMSRLAQAYRQPLYSVMFYLGRGTGARDTGAHQLRGPEGLPALTWRYQVIRLWQMSAAELLAIGRLGVPRWWGKRSLRPWRPCCRKWWHVSML